MAGVGNSVRARVCVCVPQKFDLCHSVCSRLSNSGQIGWPARAERAVRGRYMLSYTVRWPLARPRPAVWPAGRIALSAARADISAILAAVPLALYSHLCLPTNISEIYKIRFL